MVALLFLLASFPLSAQVSPAGHWRTLHSEHFRVHFRPGTDSLAHHAIAEAERAWFLLSTELVPPRQDIDLVLSDAADFSNGSASVFPTNRIVLLLTPPTSEPDLQNFDDWVRGIVTHEVSHIFHLDRVKGPWGLVQSVLGRVPGAFPNLYQPSWVTEGLATYYESHFTGRGRIRGSFHTQVLAAAARDEQWPDPNESNYISEKWPDGLAPYAFGSRFFGQITRDAGDSVVPRYVEATSGQWIPFRTGRPLTRATGLDRDSAWRAMGAEYEERSHAASGSGAEIVERALQAPPAPAVAPDGTLAWFAARLGEVQSIVVRRPDGSEQRYRTTGGVDLAWNGDTLYATRLELADPVTFRSDLHQLVKGQWTQVTHGERLTELAAGPGGVVAVQLTDQGNRLVRVSHDSIQPLLMVPTSIGETVASPSVNQSGKITVVWQNDGIYHLLAGDDSSAALELTANSNEILADPLWLTGDRERLLFVSDFTGLPQIYHRSLDQGVGQVTHEANGARQPALSPDGWLYFSTLESDGYALKRMRWNSETTPIHRPADTSFMQREIEPPTTRETGYSAGAALRPHYFIPYIVDKGSAGYFIGAFTSGFDPVGRLGYTVRAAASTKGGRMDLSLDMVYRRWAHHAIDLYLAQDHDDAGLIAITPAAYPVVSRERDAELGFTTTWRRWYRSATIRIAGDYAQDHFTSNAPVQFFAPEFAAASVGLALSRTLHPPLAISSEDGATLSLRYRRRWRLDQDGWSDEWRTRLALYQSLKGLGGFAHPVLAARISAATSSGPDREAFGVGGASGISYQPLPGIVAGSGRQFPVRGYQGGEIRGGTVAVGTAELRVPLALVAEPLWDLPYGLDKISLRLFYDYGRAWEPPNPGFPRWIHSAGVEVTWDLIVLYDVPLRLRTGAAWPLRHGSVTRQGDIAFGIGFGSEF